MMFKILISVCILLNGILIHIEWKRIESLEQWVIRILKRMERGE